MGQTLINLDKLTDHELILLIIQRQESSEQASSDRFEKLEESTAEKLETMSECLNGTNDILQSIKNEFTQVKVETKAVDTKADGLDKRIKTIEDSNSRWFDRGWNAINSVGLLLMTYFLGTR